MFNAKYKPTIIATQPAIGDLRQEFNDNGMHRIVHSDGTATPFVRYESFAYYGGYVSVTNFWADEGLYSAADFALMVATGVVATKQQAADFESGKGRVDPARGRGAKGLGQGGGRWPVKRVFLQGGGQKLAAQAQPIGSVRRVFSGRLGHGGRP